MLTVYFLIMLYESCRVMPESASDRLLPSVIIDAEDNNA